ncbi:MAG: MoaD/ThiS family protein [Anaerolineae bacterium]
MLWPSATRGDIELDLEEPATLADALAQLYARFPQLAQELPPGGKTRGGLPYHFFVNRRLVPETELSSQRLRAGDRVHILSPAAGG